MKGLHLVLGAGLALSLAALGPSTVAAQAPPPAAAAAAVDQDAVTALKRMSAYLGTLTAFEIKSEISVELVMDDDQKTTVDGTARYLVRRPNGFIIEVATEQKARQYVYDGKTLTVSAPKLGFYGAVPAPPTIRQTLDQANDRYGITLPLEDLFRWSDPDEARTDELQAATVIGPATIGGVPCDQYAFREGEIDWQIWITQGDKPVPRKVVITDRTDPARPQFTARLDWNTAPQIDANTFAFTPPAGAKAISVAAK